MGERRKRRKKEEGSQGSFVLEPDSTGVWVGVCMFSSVGVMKPSVHYLFSLYPPWLFI